MHYLHIHAPGNSEISLGRITDAAVTIAKALEVIGIESHIEISAGACCGVVTIGLGNEDWDEIYDYDAEIKPEIKA